MDTVRPHTRGQHSKAGHYQIVAAAGTGKTTTLELLAQRLVKVGHNVLYLVYNKSAQKDAEDRFALRLGSDSGKVKCMTMHSAALKHLKADANFDQSKISEDDQSIKKAILSEFSSEIIQFLRLPQSLTAKQRKRKMDLCAWWIFKTLLYWAQSSGSLKDFGQIYKYTYYPCKLNHYRKFGKDHGGFYVEMASRVYKETVNPESGSRSRFPLS